MLPEHLDVDRVSTGVLSAMKASYKKHGYHKEWVLDSPPTGYYEDYFPNFVHPSTHNFNCCVGVYRKGCFYDGSDELMLIDSGSKWFHHTPRSNYYDGYDEDDDLLTTPPKNNNSMYLLYFLDDPDLAIQFVLRQRVATRMVDPAFATRHVLHDEESERKYKEHNRRMDIIYNRMIENE